MNKKIMLESWLAEMCKRQAALVLLLPPAEIDTDTIAYEVYHLLIENQISTNDDRIKFLQETLAGLE